MVSVRCIIIAQRGRRPRYLARTTLPISKAAGNRKRTVSRARPVCPARVPHRHALQVWAINEPTMCHPGLIAVADQDTIARMASGRYPARLAHTTTLRERQRCCHASHARRLVYAGPMVYPSQTAPFTIAPLDTSVSVTKQLPTDPYRLYRSTGVIVRTPVPCRDVSTAHRRRLPADLLSMPRCQSVRRVPGLCN